MATNLTHDEIERAILDIIATYNIQANEIAPLLPISIKLDAMGVRSAPFYAALDQMSADGLIEVDGKFIKLLAAGYAKM